MTEHFQRIRIRLGIGYLVTGYLIEQGYAMYYSRYDGEIILLKVTKHNGEYRQEALITVGFSDVADVIPEIVRKLRTLTAWEVLTRYINWRETPIEFDFTR